jgi:hypothetical protein
MIKIWFYQIDKFQNNLLWNGENQRLLTSKVWIRLGCERRFIVQPLRSTWKSGWRIHFWIILCSATRWKVVLDFKTSNFKNVFPQKDNFLESNVSPILLTGPVDSSPKSFMKPQLLVASYKGWNTSRCTLHSILFTKGKRVENLC